MNEHLGPNDIPQLYECLKAAISQDQHRQKQAEATLVDLESRHGYTSCLAEIIGNKSLDHSARWLAIIQFKNSINKHWKLRPGKGGITDDEKQHLRQKLGSLIDQEDAQFAVQVAVCFGKVARQDFPKTWPSLFEDITGHMQSGGALANRRVYLVLHHVLKELATKRLATDKKHFAQVRERLLDPYFHQWLRDTEELLEKLPWSLEAPEQSLALSLTFERWLLQLKGLQRLLLYGFPSDAQSLESIPVVGQVAPAFMQSLQALYAVRLQHMSQPSRKHSQLAAMLDRAVLKLSKCLTDLVNIHPWSMLQCAAFQPALEFACGQIVNHRAGSKPFEAFLRRCILYIHSIVKSPAYEGSMSSSFQVNLAARTQAAMLKKLAAEASAVLTSFWGSNRRQMLCTALIEHFLPLTVILACNGYMLTDPARDLHEWEDNPECFHHEADVGSWEDHLRSCAETLFAVLLEDDRNEVAPVVVSMLKAKSEACLPGTAASQQGPRTGNIPAAVLAKEAVYNAAGVGAYGLHDYIDFKQWFQSTLLQDMADKSAEARPLRRRAAMLLGQWAVKVPATERPAAYRSLITLMSEEDAAVQLAAVNSLRELVEDWEFQEGPFMEFVAPALQLLAGLLHTSGELETQLQVFNLFNLIIERLGDDAKPYGPGILQLLPAVWQQAGGQSLLRIQVLVALQRLLNALGPESPASYGILQPLLRHCTDPNQPDELNLMEDGLQLWLIALRNAPAPQAWLLDLFSNLCVVMEKSTEHISPCSAIMQSCILLGGPEFLSAHGRALNDMLCNLLGNVKERGMLLLLPVMALMLCMLPEHMPSVMQPSLERLLHILLTDEESTQVTAGILGILARLLLQKTTAFLSTMSQAQQSLAGQLPNAGQPAAQPGEQLLLAVVDVWLDKFDCVASPYPRKLHALAMCLLLTLPSAPMLYRLEPLLGHISSVWFEVEGNDGPGTLLYGHDFFQSTQQDAGDPAMAASEDAEGENSRRAALQERDIVLHLRLSEQLKEKLTACQAVHGKAFEAAFSQLSPSVAEQLKGALG